MPAGWTARRPPLFALSTLIEQAETVPLSKIIGLIAECHYTDTVAQIFTVLPVIQVALTLSDRRAKEHATLAVRSQASSAAEPALSALNPTLRLPLSVLRFSSRSLTASGL